MDKFSTQISLIVRSCVVLMIVLGLAPIGVSQAQSADGIQGVTGMEVSAASTTTLVSVSSAGEQANANCEGPIVSADGRFVAFSSIASNLVENDTNNVYDAFVYDRLTGETTRVSVSSTGEQGNDHSFVTSITADGRFVVIGSSASNLVSGDFNEYSDMFVHDRLSGETTRVSVTAVGVEGNNDSGAASISADSRFVAFDSKASNLVFENSYNYQDIFVKDRQTGELSRVSIFSSTNSGDGNSSNPSISANGRFVAFESYAANLVYGDENESIDVFVHDRETGETTRVSVSSAGVEGDNISRVAKISADGRYVAFVSWAGNLVPGDTNKKDDIFVHDRQAGLTTRESVSTTGLQANDMSYDVSISGDGKFVAFVSMASNLVSGDTNGVQDIFIRDRQKGVTTRVSVSTSGVQSNGFSLVTSISADSGIVAFHSIATNLVPGDTNGFIDIFVVNRGGSSIAGTVLAENLSPLAGVTLNLINNKGILIKTTSSEANGGFKFTGLNAKTYTLRPTKPGYSFIPGSLSVKVPPNTVGQDFIGVPVAHSPASKEKISASKVTFAWDAISEAAVYKLQLSDKPDFSVLLINVKIANPTYFFDNFLNYNQIYYWRIKPIFADIKGPWSPTWQFTSMDRLTQPLIIAPANDATIDYSGVTFEWSAVDNADQYKVVIAKDALFQNKVTSFKTTDATATINLPDGKYFWRVRPLDPYGAKGPWSDYRKFTVDAE